MGTISFICSIKDNQGYPASPEIKRNSDYEYNNSFKNYLNVLTGAFIFDTIKHLQVGP